MRGTQTALRLLPPVSVAPMRVVDGLRIELQASRTERLAYTDVVRDLLRVGNLVKLERRNEREALRARSVDLGRCPDGLREPGHGKAS